MSRVNYSQRDYHNICVVRRTGSGAAALCRVSCSVPCWAAAPRSIQHAAQLQHPTHIGGSACVVSAGDRIITCWEITRRLAIGLAMVPASCLYWFPLPFKVCLLYPRSRCFIGPWAMDYFRNKQTWRQIWLHLVTVTDISVVTGWANGATAPPQPATDSILRFA